MHGAHEGRIEAIQYARAAAALVVMLSHAAGDVAAHGGVRLGAFVGTGAAGVDLFFIVSGFVMVHSSAHLFGATGARRLFLRRRLWRVVPLYWGMTLAYLALQAARGNGHAIGMEHLAASLVFLPAPNPSGSLLPTYGIGWTLNYEMFFYACFAAALGLAYHRGLALVAGALGLLAVLNAMFDLPQPIRFWAHPVVLEFLLGIACAALFRAGVRLAPSAARLMVVVGLAALAGTSVLGIGFSPDAPDQAMQRWLVWGVPCCLCFAGTVLHRAAGASPHPFVSRLGDASYALYLVHPLVIITLRPVLPWLTGALRGDATLAGLIQIGLDGAVAVACAIAIHRGVERPILRAVRGTRPAAAVPTA